jgi:hypothetical protein
LKATRTAGLPAHAPNFSAAAIAHLRATGHDVIEPTPEAEREWVAHTNEVAEATVLPNSPTPS